MLSRLRLIDVYAEELDHLNISDQIYIDTHTTNSFPDDVIIFSKILSKNFDLK